MKVTVVGCWGGFPKVKEATSGYLIQEEGFNLLVDCGSGVLSQLQSYIGIDSIDAVLLSHYHHDHIADIGPLQFARLVKSQTGEEQLPELPVYGHRFNETEFQRLTYKTYTKGEEYNPALSIMVGPFKVSFLQTKHPVPCYAMLIEGKESKVVYTADSAYQDSFVSFCHGSDLLLCECNLYKGMDGTSIGHMTSEDAGRLASEANVGKLILTHLPHFGEVEQLVVQAKEHYNGDVELASSGLVWEKE
ncbi:MBL fold metallo-hydrolase [Alkalihalobacillus sp. AL-G]|uniref:MBL fold metallo-hydrolase n=1 Tax=Alkalihalobacillus sp. AL-G TaxID=2926399 RepID=UPI00272BCC7F|nr:MBL fold metallo-hydrolase [Alkalihalobacillus sp. AL-G]WLD95337.1 MBL fold metallo-hydrolase [Alkalihalobacillus sp. AL-G]